MTFVARIAVVVLLVPWGMSEVSSSAEPAAPRQLGAAEFRPTPERPFGWRGDGSGRFSGATPVTEWSAKKHVRWTTVVGASYSSPILADKVAIVTSEPNLVVCVDRANGMVLWKVEVTPADLPDVKSRKIATEYEPPTDGAGMAAATPVTDGKSVYAVFANGIVRAIALNGKPRWIACIDAEQSTGYGRSASPILVDGKLIVSMTYLYAFDPATGKELWRNTDAKSCYGTPLGFPLGGVQLIVTPVGEVVRAADGKSLNSRIGYNQHSGPIAEGDIVYFAENLVSAVRLNAAFKDQELWSATLSNDVFGSPLLHDGMLFTVMGKGELFAFKAQGKGSQDPTIDGRLLFGESGEKAGPNTYASLTLAGKYLFCSSTRGEMVVLEATREAKLVGKNTMSHGAGATPVFSGKDMFLRGGDRLYCIGE